MFVIDQWSKAMHNLAQSTIGKSYSSRKYLHRLIFHRKLKWPVSDVELQPLELEREVRLQRNRLTQILFGKQSLDQKSPILPTTYLDHLQDQIHALGKGRLNALLKALLYDTPASDDRYLSVVADVAEICKDDQREDKSIHNILQRLLEAHGAAEHAISDENKMACWQSIFLILCWVTLIFQPSSTCETRGFPVPLPSCCIGKQTSQRVEAARRPITRVLRGFGDLLPELEQAADTQRTSLLYASSLNFHALRLFGRVTIQWTNAMSAHLRFHPATRTLHVFRFPSVCAMFLEVPDNASVLHRWEIPEIALVRS